MSNPNYDRPYRLSVSDLIGRVRDFIQRTDHRFWPDEISLFDAETFEASRIHGPRRLTDLYLLALASKNHGRLVTFDQGIPLSAVIGATAENLYIV